MIRRAGAGAHSTTARAGFSAVLSRFVRWLKLRKLQAKIAALEADLTDVRALRMHCEVAQDIIVAERERAQVALYHATRKGGL